MNFQKQNNFILFSNCIPVFGAEKSIICDLQKQNYIEIPNDFYYILINCKSNTIQEIINLYGNENEEIILEYFNYLSENDMIYFCDKNELELFPELSLKWHCPSEISNAIIDIDKIDKINYIEIFQQLSELNCKALQLRFYCKTDIETIENFIKILSDLDINSIEITIPFSQNITNEKIIDLSNKYKILKYFLVHSSPEFKIPETNEEINTTIVYLTQQIKDNQHCGNIHQNHFNTNISFFTEAQNHNTCLNRKISIDVNGEIKNCPSLKKSFGNINDTTLEQTLNKEGFKDLWFISKTQIEVCKDCEFRFICTDCRAFIENENNIYSKPAKCKYNPYTAEWKD